MASCGLPPLCVDHVVVLGETHVRRIPARVCSLLQYSENATVIGPGCAGLSPCSANRAHRVARPAWRAASPIRPDLGFRHAQDEIFGKDNIRIYEQGPSAAHYTNPRLNLSGVSAASAS